MSTAVRAAVRPAVLTAVSPAGVVFREAIPVAAGMLPDAIEAEPVRTSVAVRLVSGLGRVVRRPLSRLGEVGRLAARTAVATREWRTWLPHVGPQARLLGVDSLPLGLFIACFTGIVLALLASYSFTRAVPLYFVGVLVEKTITLELAPVLTGLALAGRVGADIAAELGTMKATEQVDALETLGFDPYAYLVLPRVLAGMLMFPVVVGLAMVVGIAAGWLASILLLGLSSPQFVKGLRLFFQEFDVRYGLVKSASFGVAVTLLGACAGLRTRGGAQGVGRAAIDAVVASAIAILVLDAFWAVVWLLGRSA